MTGATKTDKRTGASLFASTVHPLNFSVLSGTQFERLVFAAVYRRWHWLELAWLGQTGADGGRDIIGVREDDHGQKNTFVFACANWQSPSLTKATTDIDKITSQQQPYSITIVAGSAVSADMRQKITDYASTKGVAICNTWSGVEVEELLRLHAGSVLKRFYGGIALPNEEQELKDAATEFSELDDSEKARILQPIFDREAFSARFRKESSLPAFRSALTSTIEALNTGISRARDGTVVRRVPRRQDFSSPKVRAQIDRIYKLVVSIRTLFDDGLRSGEIEPCGCGNPDCPTFMITSDMCQKMNRMRDTLHKLFREACSS